MRFFWHTARLAFKTQSAYRIAMWSGLVTNLFFGFFRVALLLALFGERGEVNQFTRADSITFVALGQSLISFLTLFGYSDLMRSVYSGAIGADLLRPTPLILTWAARDLGIALLNLLGRGVLFMLLFSLLYPVTYPSSLEQWLLLAVSLLLAWGLSFTWRFWVNLVSFWTPDATGILRIAFTVSQLCCGFIMPLRLLPDWFGQMVAYTPFPGMLNTPLEVYLGTVTGVSAWQSIAGQVLWLGILLILAELTLRAGVRRLVIQGG